jgi:hypothetical protein
LSNYGQVPKGYWMDESNPGLLVLRRKKDGLRLAFFPPERATRIAVLQTVVKDREWEKIVRSNSKRRRGC